MPKMPDQSKEFVCDLTDGKNVFYLYHVINFLGYPYSVVENKNGVEEFGIMTELEDRMLKDLNLEKVVGV